MVNDLERFYQDNFDSYVKRITRKAGSPENAEDIVQEAFYRALKYGDTFDPRINKMETWFNSIVKRAMYDFKRVEMRQGMAIEREGVVEEAIDLNGFDQKLAEDIERLIEHKQTKHRNILYLYFVRNYPPRDIVQIVDENIGNVKQILNRFKIEIGERYGAGQETTSRCK